MRQTLFQKNVIAFKHKLLNEKKNAALPSPNHSNTFRQIKIKSSCRGRTEAEKRVWREELLPEEKKKESDRNTSKRRRKMDPALTSTPAFRARQNHGDKINTSPITISPVKMFDISRDLVDPDAYLSMETSASSGGGILKRTHMSPTRLSKTHADLDDLKSDKEVRKGVMEVHTVQGISWKNEMKSYAFRHGGEIGFRTPAKMVFQGGEKEIYERITGAREKVTSERQELTGCGSPQLRKRKPVDQIGLPSKILTPANPKVTDKEVIHMEVGEEEDD